MPEDAARLFFALLPDAGARRHLCRLQQDLHSGQGRVIPAENLHLTLLFLGPVAMRKIAPLQRLLAQLPRGDIKLTLDRFGQFRQKQSRTLWVGPSAPPPELTVLHAFLREQVKRLDLSAGGEVFRPHVTLIRKAALRARLPAAPDAAVIWAARRAALLSSSLSADGARYQVRAEVDLRE